LLSIHDINPSDIIETEYKGKLTIIYITGTAPGLKMIYGIRLTPKHKHDKRAKINKNGWTHFLGPASWTYAKIVRRAVPRDDIN
jgi:hypothetical protein